MIPIGETIRKERMEQGYSIDNLAYLVNIKPQHLWQIEKGKIKSPRLVTIQKIAKVLGLSVDDLIKIE